jgi:glycosyltransferase involved in cell wall biosynthesis
MRELLRLADHVFYQSEFCRMAADRFLGVQPRSSEVLYNPVDTDAFSPSDRAPASTTLLLAGNQAKAYRVRTALDVLARVAGRIADARLVITGRLGWAATDDLARADVMKWAGAAHLTDRVTLAGAYVQADAPQIFRSASLLLHTKYNDPCPTVVLEALACGLPVVYSATGGVPELVGADAGIGVPGEIRWDRDVPPDADALADAVLRVMEHYQTYRDAARKRAVVHFDTTPWLQRHAEVFGRLAA